MIKDLSQIQRKWSSCPGSLEYIASVENRPNRFFKFSFNFDFQKFKKNKGTHSNNHKIIKNESYESRDFYRHPIIQQEKKLS